MDQIIANYQSDCGSENEQLEVRKSRKRKAYTTAFKLEAIDYEKKVSSVSAAAKKYSISRGCLQDWKKQENQLRLHKDSSLAGKSKKHLPGAGRPLTFKDLDNALAVWVRSDGKNNLPYILLPKKHPVPLIVEKYKNKLLLSWAGKVWMDDSLTADYLQRVFGWSLFGKRLLVWDSFRCHISEATKNQLKILNLHTAVIPGGCTKFIQAPDVVWNDPFKAKLQQLYNTWMLNGAQKEWTASGNPRPASMEVYLEWICTAWESISKESIIKSFKDCGIKVCHDGSEDDLIHCFKQNGPVPEGRNMLKFARACILNEANEPAEADPEQDEENGYISDQSLDFETDDFLV